MKPHLFRRNGRWYCEAAKGMTTSGETPWSAYTQWRLQFALDALNHRFDEDRRQRAQRLDYPPLPQFYPTQPQQVRGVWEAFPPGTVICHH